jgi:hypothetical protein
MRKTWDCLGISYSFDDLYWYLFLGLVKILEMIERFWWSMEKALLYWSDS